MCGKTSKKKTPKYRIDKNHREPSLGSREGGEEQSSDFCHKTSIDKAENKCIVMENKS